MSASLLARATAFTFASIVLVSGCVGGEGRSRQSQPAGDTDITGPDGSAGDATHVDTTTDTTIIDTTEPEPCGGCPSGQICVADACQPLPTQCPCPLESYCDLTTDQCVAGCITDDECLSGRICDLSRTCRPGCRQSSDCAGAGQVCDMATLSCRQGCTSDPDCTVAGQICDPAAQSCRPGCRGQGDCAAETVCVDTRCVPGCERDADCTGDRICAQGQCRQGCRQRSDCTFPQLCSPDFTCVNDTFKEIAAGGDFTCGLLKDYSRPYCWGGDDFGQASPPSRSFDTISAGLRLACGMLGDNAVECWGSNEHGGRDVPAIPGFWFRDISVGSQYVCASTSRGQGERICWGLNLHGHAPPEHTLSNIEYRFMRTSERVACAIVRLPTREVNCWGDVDRRPTGSVLDMALATAFGVVIRTNGQLESWAYKTSVTPPTVPSGLYDQVTAGGGFACALERDTGEVRCFGSANTHGELSPPPGPFTQISAGFAHACGLRADGSAVCWGRNESNQTTMPW